jgi:hypothetical protein
VKKLLLILLVITGISSCTEQTIIKKDLPIEIVNLKENKKFDTLLVIETEKSFYQFNEKQEYIGKMNKTYDSFFEAFLCFFIICSILIFFALAFID